MDNNKIKNLSIIILSLLTIYFCFRSIYLNHKLNSDTGYIRTTSSVPDTVYKNLDEFKKVEPFNNGMIPTKVTLFKNPESNSYDSVSYATHADDTLSPMTGTNYGGYSSGFLGDSIYQFLLSKDFLSLTFKNVIDSTYKIEDYPIDLDNYAYNWVDGKLTVKEVGNKINLKLVPYIQGKYRVFNNFWDLSSGISLETKRFNYNLGVNLFYYPSLQKSLGKDLEISITYKFK